MGCKFLEEMTVEVKKAAGDWKQRLVGETN